jgi:hypothetical protein
MMMTWTQPFCEDCWNRANPGRQPVKLNDPEVETCCICGVMTTSGIYQRINPKEVEHPKVGA